LIHRKADAKVQDWTQVAKQIPARYATRADFCRIFHEEMNSLYLLSSLLTADDEKAEKCFVRGLEDSADGTPVFREWAHSWARRTIIQNAVRMIGPRPTDSNSTSIQASGGGAANMRAEIAAIVELPAFDRFAFVLSVFEHFSDQECSLLLSCTSREVIAARTRTFERLANLGRYSGGGGGSRTRVRKCYWSRELHA